VPVVAERRHRFEDIHGPGGTTPDERPSTIALSAVGQGWRAALLTSKD
jgi:hypothetical protein